MKQKTVTVACTLTEGEYQRFKEICGMKDVWPSAAVREAVMEWMEKNRE